MTHCPSREHLALLLAERLGGAEVLARLAPSRCEADRQLEQTDPREAAAALVRRSLA